MKLTLTRRSSFDDMGVFGELRGPEFLLQTVERPWLNNQPYISCIPKGRYTCRQSFYNRGGYDTFEVMSVPDRSLIKFHVGNTMEDVLGCVALGTGKGFVDGKWAVTNSQKAFDTFWNVMKNQPYFDLEVKWLPV